VHLGAGAFHRAHQAVYTDDLLNAAGGDWGITAVSMRRPEVAQNLREQDGLYAIAEYDAAGGLPGAHRRDPRA
jgi:fructuronate reductase